MGTERFYPYNKGYLDYGAGGFKPCDERGRFDFATGTIRAGSGRLLRNADAAYSRRMMDPTLASTLGGQARRSAREGRRSRSDRQRGSATSLSTSSDARPGFTMRGSGA